MFAKVLNLRVMLFFSGGSVLLALLMLAGIYLIILPKLPDIESLKDVQLQVPLRVYSRDERLIAEFGEKKRSPMDIEDAPKTLINAVLAAEDDRFFEHPGVDYKGMLRAVYYLLRTGEKGQGGSTITMQVARNFFLSREKTYLRKLNEILLSFKIENELSKNEILELYINKIYLGNRSYGFGAAAQVYYGKSIYELNVAQTAMIAGLPKAPSRFNPVVNPKRALQRRNYILNRMQALGFLGYDEHQEALAYVDDSALHSLSEEVSAPYIAEMVRADMFQRYGDEAYTKGYRVFTSITARLQTRANDALRAALMQYDERHGYRGPEAKVEFTEASVEEDWRALLAPYRAANEMLPALVVEINAEHAVVYQPSYGRLQLNWDSVSWARPWLGDGLEPGVEPKFISDVLSLGDIIRIVHREDDSWHLAQIPNAEAALVSLSSRDGAVMALVGGFDFSKSNFNRVLQAERQPGSNLKPFTYSAALEKGYTAASVINDAPVVFEDAGLESTWRPENYSGKVFGPTRFREALVASRNLVSIRILRSIGISYAIEYLEKFGFNAEKLPRDLSLALGSAAITPMELVTGYASFANGGYKIEPYFIDRIENDEGEVVYRADPMVVCEECPETLEVQPIEPALTVVENEILESENTQPVVFKVSQEDGALEPQLDTVSQEKKIKPAPRIITPQNVYIMTSVMRDVIQRGTGIRAKSLERNDIAGKTGTTNDQRDAWFSGFSPDVVATAWVGFDTPKPLGDRETGGKAALPMWIHYMEEALKDLPDHPAKMPAGLVTVKVDKETGLLTGPGSDGIFEVFREEFVPTGTDDAGPAASGTTAGTVEEAPEIF
ncbi:MAG: penicillin-binding protein 1A [Gammaproteobacteria bacterium]|nr:penicillin-binding protein 1A [Gammaproteobacteria bacterium]MDH5801744.1 penicillin-binding protein 1A [Gammaproteobacteria bacterium]